MADTRAVVIGGSMAGMCAARVLSDFFDRVTVIDRDSYPDGALERAGVPQSRHVHALLARGRRELEGLFPGFDRGMIEHGAHEINFGVDFAALRPDGWAKRQGDGIQLLFASRMLLEAIVRELLRKQSNVEFVERTECTGFIVNQGEVLRARGVKLRARDGGGAHELAADLVVDASGRSSKSPQWLKEIGLPAPQESVVDSFSSYVSRWFQAPPPERRPREWWWKGVWIDPVEPDHLTAGVLFPVERNRWIVTIAGINKHHPPSDERGFMETLGQLRSPIIAEAVKLAQPISPVYSNRAMANRWRHYETWTGRLDGFVAIGDSSCAFNPVYGQGMTTGAMSALTLRECLKQYGPLNPELARNFLREQTKVQRDPWSMATGADFRFEGTEGERPRQGKILGRYMASMIELASDDPVLGRRLSEVINMLRPLSALFALPIAARVVVSKVKRYLRPKKAETRPIPALPPVTAIVS